MRIAPGLLRLKLYLNEDGHRVVVALIVIAALAFGGAVITLADPPQQTVTEQRHQQTVGMDVESSAVVTGDTDLYEQGTRLRGMPVYLRSATPTLRPVLRTAVPAGTDVQVTQRLWVSYTAKRNGGVFWEDRQPLASQTTRISGRNATLETEVQIADVQNRLQEIESKVANVGQLSVRLHGEVEYETDRYEGSLTDSAPLEITDRSYWLSGDVSAEETHTTPVTRQRLDQQGVTVVALPRIGELVIPDSSILWAVIGAVCLAGAGWIRQFRQRRIDEAALRETLARERFDEWISRGRVPKDTGERTVYVESLEDLVDVAIDSSKRVIRDPERELYVVVDGDVVYRYQQGGQFGPFVPKSPQKR